MSKRSTPYPSRRRKGFQQTANLLQPQIRRVGESRGFAVSRLLTHWTEIVGTEIAAIARPVHVSYGRQGLGATLTILTSGAQAPILEMRKEWLREKVNACYGYAAIRQIRLTQTSPEHVSSAFAQDGPEAPAVPDPEITRIAGEAAAPVRDPGLRAALERLGTHVLGSDPNRTKDTP
ncbi:hypothetical protein LX81_01903 [Palleronia aestuarii]|uniref:Uncharacterized protein n=1 Tax=Palleronia aestuarii TaxID=568105 RepID=A0A2W7NIM2_9RHOB|nr:DUF721 domain-containing protein [Palleronia aestuarii]PZX16534.1 hypothetical protein LX81_01903 [Palleronia aestuarii]